jgi:ribosomal protein S18 acetylase RimI-like enzyme
MSLIYRINAPFTAEQTADLYVKSGLSRPKDLSRIERMVQNANVIITAWDGDQPVGLLRALTDFAFDCYLSDLAVDKNYQKRGIGKELVRQLQTFLGDEVMILLLSARDAVDFYKHIGFEEPQGALWIQNKG